MIYVLSVLCISICVRVCVRVGHNYIRLCRFSRSRASSWKTIYSNEIHILREFERETEREKKKKVVYVRMCILYACVCEAHNMCFFIIIMYV